MLLTVWAISVLLFTLKLDWSTFQYLYIQTSASQPFFYQEQILDSPTLK
jgi:hypothetical protein